LIGLIVAAVYFAHRYIDTDSGRRVWDRLKLNAPLFAPLMRKLYMARFMRTGETLLASGVQMLEALAICSRAVNNVIVSDSINAAAEKVKGVRLFLRRCVAKKVF
jgi:type II secretory pathway component PulF